MGASYANDNYIDPWITQHMKST